MQRVNAMEPTHMVRMSQGFCKTRSFTICGEYLTKRVQNSRSLSSSSSLPRPDWVLRYQARSGEPARKGCNCFRWKPYLNSEGNAAAAALAQTRSCLRLHDGRTRRAVLLNFTRLFLESNMINS
jgi:hypothetical protein